MGIDAEIYFRMKEGKELPASFERDIGLAPDGEFEKIKPLDAVCVEDYEDPRPQYQVYTLMRYYGPGYERGPWEIISKILMTLYASGIVEKVWYGGDCTETIEECPIEKVLEISKHYMENGHEPYAGKRLW